MNSGLASVSQKTRKLYGPEKPFVKLQPAYSVKLVFSYVVKGVKVKITAKFRDTGLFRFEDTKRIVTRKDSDLSRNKPLNGVSNSDPCDSGALLHQKTCRANWELVVMWVDHRIAKKLRRALTHSLSICSSNA